MDINVNTSTSGQNAFYCPHCKEVTKHIKVGVAERCKNRSTGVKLFASFCDTFGFTNMHHAVFGCQDWKCMKCAKIHERDSSGMLDDIELDSNMSDGGEGWKEYENGIYHGRFWNFQRHGYGVYEYFNGDIYIGNWDHDNRHGRGKYMWSDGTEREGIWELDDIKEWL